ncbi:MAG: hypothetical protein R2873_36470 [Caldilineaceae bacterium]
MVGLNLDSKAKLTIVLDAQPDSRQNFRFTGDLGDFILDDGSDRDSWTNTAVFEGLLVGEAQSVVMDVPPFWYLTDISCDAADALVVLNRSSVTVTPGFREEICTFTTKLTSAIWAIRLQ